MPVAAAEAMPSGMPYPSLATERFSPVLAPVHRGRLRSQVALSSPARQSALAWSPWPLAPAATRSALAISLSLGEHLTWRRRFDDLLTTAAIGLAAARRLGDGPGKTWR